jgi:hypothetical protein
MFKLVEQYQASDIPKGDFCARHRIKMTTFTWWQRIYRKEKPDSVPEVKSNPSFIPVKGPVDLIQAGYEYRFQDGNRLIIPGTKAIHEVIDLVKGLQDMPCSR